MKALEKADRDYKQRELQMTYKYYDFLERQAVNLAGCDAACVDQCTNPSQYPLELVPECIAECDCEGGAIRLTDGDYDINRLSFFAKNDASAMSFFHNNFKLWGITLTLFFY